LRIKQILPIFLHPRTYSSWLAFGSKGEAEPFDFEPHPSKFAMVLVHSTHLGYSQKIFLARFLSGAKLNKSHG